MPRFLTPYELDEIFDVMVDRNIPLPTELQSNFGRVIEFETETIDLDKIESDLRIGIFVSPDNNAKPTTKRGYTTKVFYPGYWKDKATVDFRNIRSRMPGQKLAQPVSNAGKVALALADAQRIMEAKRKRLLEWIAAQILLTGKYTATSELHPPIEIDLERNVATDEATLNGGRANQADLTAITANGGVGKRAWGSTGGTVAVSPVADLEQMLEAAWEPITKLYIANDAWKELIKDPDFDKFVDTTRSQLSDFKVDLLPKQFTPEGLKFRGTIGAQNIPIWTYNATYQPTTSTTAVKFIPDGYVVMVPASVYGVQAYGAVQHGLADFRAKELFWNSWIEEEGGRPWLQGQCAPAFLHTKINSTVAWKVM